MQHPIPIGFSPLSGLQTGPQTRILLDEIYPLLFGQLNTLNESLAKLKQEPGNTLADTALLKMNEELDELYRKEKLVLYPFLLQLEAEQKQSDCCKPFKNVKKHYTCLLATGTQLLGLLEPEGSVNPQPAKVSARQLLGNFIQMLIKVQLHKEKYLLARFRNCTGSCKSINDD